MRRGVSKRLRYSYVLHDRLTKEGEQQLHSHVILPGLAPTVAGMEAALQPQKQRPRAVVQ